jgi:uncharacterized protein (TIGR04141 family)
MARKPKQQKLTVALLKDGLGAGDALRGADALTSYAVSVLANEPSLYLKATPPHPPRWLGYLHQHVSGGLPDLYTASSAAVLFVRASDRLFAFTFGQGRHLLDPNSVEPDFGLRVVLNTVAPDQLKSVDSKTIDETTMHTRRDVSRDSSLAAFGLDVSRDLVRAVTGRPQDPVFGPRLTGADSLGLHTRAAVPELPELASRLLEAYEDDSYKTYFDFIDYLRPERSLERVQELEEKLLEALNSRQLADIHLAAPEPLDWLDVDGFRFSTQESEDEPQSDPRITIYLDSRAGEEISIPLLKGDRMDALRASDGEPYSTWPVLRCIVYEAEVDGQLYVLSAGEWFRVTLDFKELVYSYVNGLATFAGLPDADPGTDEGIYNAKAAATLGALCLDRKLVYDGGPDRMEICDVLTREGALIHVKQRGASSTLSHLFTQGLNSGERLLQDPEFRLQAREIIAAEAPEFQEVITEARPQPEAHQIVFAVITRSVRQTPLTLPFFSLVSLRAAARRLQGYGFDVAVAAVKEQ